MQQPGFKGPWCENQAPSCEPGCGLYNPSVKLQGEASLPYSQALLIRSGDTRGLVLVTWQLVEMAHTKGQVPARSHREKSLIVFTRRGWLRDSLIWPLIGLSFYLVTGTSRMNSTWLVHSIQTNLWVKKSSRGDQRDLIFCSWHKGTWSPGLVPSCVPNL